MSKAQKFKRSHLYRPYPPGSDDCMLLDNDNSSVHLSDPIVSGVTSSLTHNEWDDWNINLFSNGTDEIGSLPNPEEFDYLFGYSSDKGTEKVTEETSLAMFANSSENSLSTTQNTHSKNEFAFDSTNPTLISGIQPNVHDNSSLNPMHDGYHYSLQEKANLSSERYYASSLIDGNTGLNSSGILQGLAPHINTCTIHGVSSNTMNANTMNTTGIHTSCMSSNTMNTSCMNSNTMNTSCMNSNTMSTSCMNANTMSTNGMSTNGMNSNGMNTNSMNSTGMNTNSMNSTGISTNSINTNSINTNGMNANGMNANGMNSNGMNSNTMNANGMNSNTMNPNDIPMMKNLLGAGAMSQYMQSGMYSSFLSMNGTTPSAESNSTDANNRKVINRSQPLSQQMAAPMMMMPPGMLLYPSYGMMPYPNMFGMGMAVAMPVMNSQSSGVPPNSFVGNVGNSQIRSSSGEATTLVTIARKPGDEAPNSSLQLLLQDEEDKRAKKLERNRNGARDSRKKNQDYVEGLEAAIKNLNVSRSLVTDHRWGKRDPSSSLKEFNRRAIDLIGEKSTISSDSSDADIFVHTGNIKRTLKLNAQHRNYFAAEHFCSIGYQLQELQSALLEIGIVLAAHRDPKTLCLQANSDTCRFQTFRRELCQLLDLSEEQENKVRACISGAMLEARNIAILVRCFKFLRNMSQEFGSHIEETTKDFSSLVSQQQDEKFLLWSEKNRESVEKFAFENLERDGFAN